MRIFQGLKLRPTAAIGLASLCLSAAVHATQDLGELLSALQLDHNDTAAFADSISPVPFDQNFPSSPQPWKISVDRKFINVTKLKVALTRYHEDIDVPVWSEGPPRSNVSRLRDYWLKEYDWDVVEGKINAFYHSFTTSVRLPPPTNYSEPVALHFVHHKSQRADAIPLLFMHGTPGSFMEVGNLLEPLTNPPAGQPAFHVVAPSLPGYGFSPAPKVPGMDPTHTAAAMNQLMAQLGYERYVVQGGDYGGILLRYTAGLYPDNVVSALANFFIVAPNATDMERYAANKTTPDETAYIKGVTGYGETGSGYRLLMGNTPLQVCIATTDSPLGNLAFNWDLMKWLSDPRYEWSLEEIITWSMMYWIPGPYAAMRHYKEMAMHGIFAGPGLGNVYPYVKVPVGLSEWPGDFWYRLPTDWARRYSNTTWRMVHDNGAHFPSLQNTDELVADIRYFFGNTSLSNTGRWLN